MNEAFQPLVNLLSGHFGWMPTVMGWVAASRLALKFVNAWLQAKLTAMMKEDAETSRLEMGAPGAVTTNDWEAVLSNRWYRVMSFVLDLAFSLKLPTLRDFLTAKNAENTKKGT